MASPVGATRACTSTSRARVPSRGTVTAEPALAAWRSLKNAAEGLGTWRNPSASISKTPISLVDPKRFFSARSRR